MKITERDKANLVWRINQLLAVDTHSWHPADELEFRHLLRGQRPDQRLSLPLSGKVPQDPLPVQWSAWLRTLAHLEDLVRRNEPANGKSIWLDIAKGKFPKR